MFASVHVPESCQDQSSGNRIIEDLLRLARDFSPRFETIDTQTVVLDVAGLQGMWGDPRTIGRAVLRVATERGIRCRVALAATRITAMLLVYGRADALTVVEPGAEGTAVAALPLDILERVEDLGSNRRAATFVQARDACSTIPVRTRFGRSPAVKRYRDECRNVSRMIQTLRRWGLSTLGDLAALPRDELFSRLGAEGVAWQRCARGEELRPLVPAPEGRPFEAALDLDWPAEGLEPLAYVLGLALESLEVQLARNDAAAAVLIVRFWLVTRAWHTRTLQLPVPIRDPRILHTLLVIDLESHPPPTGIDRVVVTAIPAPARVVQFSLFERATPSAEQWAPLLARLTALMSAARCGTPSLVDTHHPSAFDVKPFNPKRLPAVRPQSAERIGTVVVLRRFHIPLAARVTVVRGCPVQVSAGGGVGNRAVERCAGPWRSSGHWWEPLPVVSRQPSTGSWSCDEWDVALLDGGVYRIYRDRVHGGWFVAGVLD